MKTNLLFNFKEGHLFKLCSDSPFIWRVIEYNPSCFTSALLAICINSPDHQIAFFPYNLYVFRYETKSSNV